MSGTENEAVQAGRDAIRARFQDPANLASVTDLAQAAYDAMREIIAREVIAGVCRREGRKRLDTTPLGSVVLEIRCGRCGETWNEPRPPYRPGGPVPGLRRVALLPGERIIIEGGDHAQG